MKLIDRLDFARRIQKLKCPSEIDSELIKGLQEAEREAVKTAELLNMMDKLERDNLVTRNKEDAVMLNNNIRTTKATMSASYIKCNGGYYHLAQFLFLQPHKVYMPSTSRSARWRAVSKVNYYVNIGKISGSKEQGE